MKRSTAHDFGLGDLDTMLFTKRHVVPGTGKIRFVGGTWHNRHVLILGQAQPSDAVEMPREIRVNKSFAQELIDAPDLTSNEIIWPGGGIDSYALRAMETRDGAAFWEYHLVNGPTAGCAGLMVGS